MSKRARTLLAIVVVELFLANTWLVLARMGVARIGVWIGPAWIGAAELDRVEPQFQATLGQTMGSAMGAFPGLGLIAFFIAAKRDREG